MMIPICHVQLFPIISGVQRAMLEIFKQLDRERFELHVACQGPGPLTEELERQGIAWHAIPALDRPIHPVRDALAYRQLKQLFTRERFAIVHTHSSKPGILGRIAARRAGVPSVVHHVQGYAFHERTRTLTRKFYVTLERSAAPYCDKLIFVNDEDRLMTIREGWAKAQQCETIYNGADLTAFEPWQAGAARARTRLSWGLEQDEVAFVFVGRLDYQKQPLAIAEVAARLQAMRPNGKWRILVAGSGPDEAALVERTRALNVTHRVKLLGWQADPVPALHGADAMLMPSLFEGLPLAMIEAYAAGKPAVASNAKGIREVVTPETGVLCPTFDYGSYAEAMARFVDNPEEARIMGAAARRRAESHFDCAINNQRVAALYDELLGMAPRASRPMERLAARSFAFTTSKSS